jgi:hypothetical protein
MDNDIYMATWGVSSLYRVGTMRGLINNIKIAAIQEMRWKDRDMMGIDEYTML